VVFEETVVNAIFKCRGFDWRAHQKQILTVASVLTTDISSTVKLKASSQASNLKAAPCFIKREDEDFIVAALLKAG